MENENILKAEFDKQEYSRVIEIQGEADDNKPLYRQGSNKFKIIRGLKIKLSCEFCSNGSLHT
ncbi:MAG TPA: hypothetical protein VEH06_17795 [Candidatus Bathyarchaeia archaeon]|nr:hypothetical protein [Candidatus Bathyarchaeia archaeon]